MRRVSEENGGTYVVKTVRKLGHEDAKESEAPISYGFMRSVRKLFLPEDKIVFIFPAVVPLHWQEEENIVLRTEMTTVYFEAEAMGYEIVDGEIWPRDIPEDKVELVKQIFRQKHL